MIRIRVGSCWATGGQSLDANRGPLGWTVSLPPGDVNVYQAFVRSVVDRYKPLGVHQYAIENEANGDSFFKGTAEQYATLVREGAQAVRQVDPTAVVLDSGLSSTTWGVVMAQALLDQGKADQALTTYQAYYERRFIHRTKDFPEARTVDQLKAALNTEQATHDREFAQATLQLAKDGVIDDFQLHFYEKWSNVPALMTFLHDVLPTGMPIQVWEAGLFWPDSNGDERVVAGETTRLVYLLLGYGARARRVPAAVVEHGQHRQGDPLRAARRRGQAAGQLRRLCQAGHVPPPGGREVVGVAGLDRRLGRGGHGSLGGAGPGVGRRRPHPAAGAGGDAPEP